MFQATNNTCFFPHRNLLHPLSTFCTKIFALIFFLARSETHIWLDAESSLGDRSFSHHQTLGLHFSTTTVVQLVLKYVSLSFEFSQRKQSSDITSPTSKVTYYSIQVNLRWKLWASWRPRDSFKAAFGLDWSLRAISWGSVHSKPPSEVTSTLSIQGNYFGSAVSLMKRLRSITSSQARGWSTKASKCTSSSKADSKWSSHD